MLKIKEAQTYSLSDQIKIRDEVILKAKHALISSNRAQERELMPGSRNGSLSSRQGSKDESPVRRMLNQSPSAKEITILLQDERIVSLEEIVRQNSLLPPIIGNNLLKERMQSNNPHGAHYAFSSVKKRTEYQSVGGVRRKGMHQNQVLLKKGLNLPQVKTAQSNQYLSPSKGGNFPPNHLMSRDYNSVVQKNHHN